LQAVVFNCINGIWGFDASHFYVVDSVGNLSTGNGTEFVLISSAGWPLHGLWGSGPDDIWAVGDHGSTLHFDDMNWNQGPTGPQFDIQAMWGADANNIWAVGTGGAMKWDRTSWSSENISSSAVLVGVWGLDSSHAWAVGPQGTVASWDGSAWSLSTTDPMLNLTGIWGSDANDIWAVGSSTAMMGNTILLAD
jgi:hypothetical protein